MDFETIFQVAIVTALASTLIFYFKNKKNNKAIASGQCPKCQTALILKNLPNGAMVKLCPLKHGYVAEGCKWVENETVGMMMKNYENKQITDIPQNLLTGWYVYSIFQEEQQILEDIIGDNTETKSFDSNNTSDNSSEDMNSEGDGDGGDDD